jgi:hypothetical protein
MGGDELDLADLMVCSRVRALLASEGMSAASTPVCAVTVNFNASRRTYTCFGVAADAASTATSATKSVARRTGHKPSRSCICAGVPLGLKTNSPGLINRALNGDGLGAADTAVELAPRSNATESIAETDRLATSPTTIRAPVNGSAKPRLSGLAADHLLRRRRPRLVLAAPRSASRAPQATIPHC